MVTKLTFLGSVSKFNTELLKPRAAPKEATRARPGLPPWLNTLAWHRAGVRGSAGVTSQKGHLPVSVSVSHLK